MKLVNKNVTDVFLPSDPTFRVSMQKWGKHCIFGFFFDLIKGTYEIVQANDRYLQKVNTMSFLLITFRPLSHSCIENMAEQNNVVIEKLPEKLNIL